MFVMALGDWDANEFQTTAEPVFASFMFLAYLFIMMVRPPAGLRVAERADAGVGTRCSRLTPAPLPFPPQIVLLNLLIAIMGDSYDRVKDKEELEFLKGKVRQLPRTDHARRRRHSRRRLGIENMFGEARK